MVKALSFVGLIFCALVVLNWTWVQMSALVPENPALALSVQQVQAQAPKVQVPAPEVKAPAVVTTTIATTIPNVPFFSQFKDIQLPEWREVGCGITSLAMVINFYKPGTVSVNTLLQQGVAAGAYDWSAGWTFNGLIQLSKKYGLTGSYHDLSVLSAKAALARFRDLAKSGPVILSVFNRFNPNSTVPHLVVVDGIKNDVVYYNDPAAKTGKKKISVANLLKGWKEKVIVLRPAKNSGAALSMADQ